MRMRTAAGLLRKLVVERVHLLPTTGRLEHRLKYRCAERRCLESGEWDKEDQAPVPSCGPHTATAGGSVGQHLSCISFLLHSVQLERPYGVSVKGRWNERYTCPRLAAGKPHSPWLLVLTSGDVSSRRMKSHGVVVD